MSTDLDYEIIRRGGVSKCFNLEKVEQYLSWFEQAGYTIYEFDAYKWYTPNDFYGDFQEVFGLPHYGQNWDAFDDVFCCDFERDSKTLVYIENFNHWHKRYFRDAQIFLDIMSDQTYSALLMNKKFATLIHSDNVKFDVQPIGARSVYELLI